MDDSPSTNGTNGRDHRGRFTEGNAGGPGNPHARSVAGFRAAMLATVTEDDLVAVVRRLVEQARAGEPWAVRELLDRTVGRVKPTEPAEDDGPIQVVWKITPLTREQHDQAAEG